MAIKINKSDETTVGNGGAKYTGLTLAKPIVVNPNKETLAKLGINLKEEPEYIKIEEKNGKKSVKIRVTWYMMVNIGEGESAHKLFVNHSVFLEPRVNVTSGEKVQMIDKYGRSCYVSKEDYKDKTIPYDWMDKASSRGAYVGEVDLIDFMRTFAGSEKDDEVRLNDFCPDGDIRKFFAPNGSGLTELKKDTHAIYKMGNVVKILLGIRYNEEQKAIQDVFSGFIGRPYSGAKYFHKQLATWKKNSPDSFRTRYYGKIDFTRDIPNENDYLLRIFEEGESQPTASSNANAGGTSERIASENDVFDQDAAEVGADGGFDPFADGGDLPF